MKIHPMSWKRFNVIVALVVVVSMALGVALSSLAAVSTSNVGWVLAGGGRQRTIVRPACYHNPDQALSMMFFVTATNGNANTIQVCTMTTGTDTAWRAIAIPTAAVAW